MSLALIDKAARNHKRTSKKGMLEGLFAKMFSSFVYPQIWEDPLVDMEALKLGEDSKIVTIASGGCNVMSYLTRKPKRLIAVDLNPAHLALLDLKLTAARHLNDHWDYYSMFGDAANAKNIQIYDNELSDRLKPESREFWESRIWTGQRRVSYFRSGLYRQGLLGRTIWVAHKVAKLHGRDLKQLLNADSMEDQQVRFDKEFAPLFGAPMVKLLFRLPTSLFGLGIPPKQFDELIAESPDAPEKVIESRTRRLLTAFDIDDNYFAHQALKRSYGKSVPPYLEQEHFPTIKQWSSAVEMHYAPVTDLLASVDTKTLTGYVFLDAQDWMNSEQLNNLWEQVTRTAQPGARVIFRTAGISSPLEPVLSSSLMNNWTRLDALSKELGDKDRSAIYGAFHIYEKN